jgi:hypothetical protein
MRVSVGEVRDMAGKPLASAGLEGATVRTSATMTDPAMRDTMRLASLTPKLPLTRPALVSPPWIERMATANDYTRATLEIDPLYGWAPHLQNARPAPETARGEDAGGHSR